MSDTNKSNAERIREILRQFNTPVTSDTAFDDYVLLFIQRLQNEIHVEEEEGHPTPFEKLCYQSPSYYTIMSDLDQCAHNDHLCRMKKRVRKWERNIQTFGAVTFIAECQEEDEEGNETLVKGRFLVVKYDDIGNAAIQNMIQTKFKNVEQLDFHFGTSKLTKEHIDMTRFYRCQKGWLGFYGLWEYTDLA